MSEARALTPARSPAFTRLSMRLASIALVALVGLAGCQSPDNETSRTLEPTPTKGGGLVANRSPGSGSGPTNSAAAAPVVLPTRGRVHMVNPGLRFVVIDYTLGGVPPLQSLLSVFRGTEKVGQVRLSGPERNGFVAADIVEGYLQVDDEVRLE